VVSTKELTKRLRPEEREMTVGGEVISDCFVAKEKVKKSRPVRRRKDGLHGCPDLGERRAHQVASQL